MEMGKLTAKLRDAVPVCLLVDGREIKRYRNIEIPDEIKKLEYQDFKFDVPANGNITFKISFASGVLPEEFPQARERKTRAPKDAQTAVVSELPDATPVEETTEAARESAAIITLQGELVEEVIKSQAAGEETSSTVEIQAGEEAKPEPQAEPVAQEPTPAKKAEAKPKKSPVKGSKK